mgnify:CR=1 FL=1
MQPSWELLGLFSAGSAALGAIATAGIINAFNRRKGRDSEPSAKRQKLSPPSPVKVQQAEAAAAATAEQEEEQLNRELSLSQAADAANQQEQDAPGTPEAEVSGAGHIPQNDSVVDLQKLQELEQRVRPAHLLKNCGGGCGCACMKLLIYAVAQCCLLGVCWLCCKLIYRPCSDAWAVHIMHHAAELQ